MQNNMELYMCFSVRGKCQIYPNNDLFDARACNVSRMEFSHGNIYHSVLNYVMYNHVLIFINNI